MRRMLIWSHILGLWRDPGALILTFVLPPAFFVILALIFSRTSGTDLEIRYMVADETVSMISEQLIAELEESGQLVRVGDLRASAEEIEPLVRSGEVDAGLVFREGEDPNALPDMVILKEPSREIAATVLEGAVRGALARVLDPDAPVLPISTRILGGGVPVSIAYYAAGVAILFVLMGAVQGAASLLDDRESGLLARLAYGPKGLGPLLDGMFLFLLTQAFLQIGIIFAVAWIGFGLSLTHVALPWLMTTFLSALVASALALAFVSLCQTKRQAEAFGPSGVLVLSAIGGSMVPRFLMPSWIQDLGWLTPNTWSLEAYAAFLWRDQPQQDLYVPWAILAVVAFLALLTARLASRRWI